MFQKLYQKYPFHPLVWYIIVETGLARIAFFMAMPFVALKMSETAGSSAVTIGAVLGFGPLAAIIIGFYVGHLSDLFGRRKIVFSSVVLWSFVFLGFSYAETPIEYAILMTFSGLARGIFEPVSTALVSDLCALQDPKGEQHKAAFHFRYYSINIGACIGPLVGASLLLNHPKLGFQIAALVYAVSAFLFLVMSNYFGVKKIEKNTPKSNHKILDVLKILKNDKVVQIYTLAFFFIVASYSQIESTLTLYLKDTYGDEGIRLFAKLLTMNAVVVVCFTIPMLSWAKRFELNTVCALSSVVWAIGYFGIGFSTEPWHYMASMGVMTLGEIIVFANGYLIIESLAPKNMKGAYYGVTNFAQTGMMIGPMFGGLLLELGGGRLVFSVMAFFLVISGVLYLVAKHKREKMTHVSV